MDTREALIYCEENNIIDDYLLWSGQKKAIDDFLSQRGLNKEIKSITNKISYDYK